ncbi:MAG: hypothetical protein R3F34_07775 [Planctomycetota bacterium]
MPCADEVWRLQNLDEPDCVHFRKFCDEGEGGRLNGRDPSETRQGTYAVTPSGILLDKINSRDPRRMAAMLRRATARYAELEPSARLLADDPRETAARIQRAENRYPSDGLVLRVDSRDLPRPGEEDANRDDGDWREFAWNFDYAWFSRAELDRTVPKELVAGASFAFPADLVQRLARLHLVDNVRGQTAHYARDQVRAASIDAEVVELLTDASGEPTAAVLRLAGVVHLDDAKTKRGVAGGMQGRATFDLATRRFTAFELLVVGERWGQTRYNQRADDLAPEPIGFAVHLAGDGPTERVAPTAFWEYGWR